MNQILVFIFTSLLFVSCKALHESNNRRYIQLEIAQNHTFSEKDSIKHGEMLPVNLIVSIDSISEANFFDDVRERNSFKVTGIKKHTAQLEEKEKSRSTKNEPENKVSKTKGLRIFFPALIFLGSLGLLISNAATVFGLIGIAIALIFFLLLNTNFLKKSESKNKSGSKVWQILVSLLVVAMGVVFIVLTQGEMLFFASIMFTIIALLLLIFAIINNLVRAQPKPEISAEQKRKSRYNKYALWAGIFFLITLISAFIGYFIFIPYLFLIFYGSLFTSLILSILSLINMAGKSEFERGKPLSIAVLLSALLPIVFLISFIGEEIIDDIF